MMGRPPIFETPEEIDLLVKDFFIECGKASIPVTISGLALYLGFESRQSFYDYEKKPDFSYTIKRARLKIEDNYEKRLDSKNPTGAIFALKNMGWKDKHEVEQSGVVTVRQYTGIENVVDDGPNK